MCTSSRMVQEQKGSEKLSHRREDPRNARSRTRPEHEEPNGAPAAVGAARQYSHRREGGERSRTTRPVANGEGKRWAHNLTKFWQIRACSTGACLEPFPYCSLGIRLDRPEQAHHDGRAGPPDPHGEEKPPMKMRRKECPALANHKTPQTHTNLNQSQPPNLSALRPNTVKRR